MSRQFHKIIGAERDFRMWFRETSAKTLAPREIAGNHACGSGFMLNHREPIQELWTDNSFFERSHPSSHVYILNYNVWRGVGERGEEGWGKGGRAVGERGGEGWGKGGGMGKTVKYGDDWRSLVRQDISQAWVWTSFIQTNRSTTLVWAPCGSTLSLQAAFVAAAPSSVFRWCFCSQAHVLHHFYLSLCDVVTNVNE